jgi:hypothetical protein
MTKLPTGTEGGDSPNAHGEAPGVFKSGDMPVHRLSPGATSAVSEVAVERGVEPVLSDMGTEDETALTPISHIAVEDAPSSRTTAEEKLEDLEVSVAKVDAIVQSVEQRQAQIEEAHQKAEAMLSEVNRIAEAMTFSNALRDRINATLARTRRLRGDNGK